MSKVEAALRAGRPTAEHAWNAADGTPCCLRVKIEPDEEFMLMSAGRPFRITDDSMRPWLDLYEGRVRDKGRRALRQMATYVHRMGMRCCAKDIVIYYDEPAGSHASLFRREDLQRIQADVTAELRAVDPTVTLSVRS